MSDINRKPIIGFLSPEGKFYECSSYGHGECAQKIASEIKHDQTLAGYRAENFLLDIGYVCFRSKDAYCNYYASEEYKLSIGMDKEARVINKLTHPQIRFIENHNRSADWNTFSQAEDIAEILEYQERLDEYLQNGKGILNEYLTKSRG